MNTRIVMLLTPLLVAACVSQGPGSLLGTQEKERQARRIEMSRTTDCVFHSTISDFEALDNRYIVLFASGRRKAYLADVSGGCFDIRSQSSLAAVDGDGNGQICGFGRDSLAYRQLGGRVEECRILGLEQLTDERREELGVGVPPKPQKEKKPEEKPGDDGKPTEPK